jgi:hypothetical protein
VQAHWPQPGHQNAQSGCAAVIPNNIRSPKRFSHRSAVPRSVCVVRGCTAVDLPNAQPPVGCQSFKAERSDARGSGSHEGFTGQRNWRRDLP